MSSHPLVSTSAPCRKPRDLWDGEPGQLGHDRKMHLSRPQRVRGSEADPLGRWLALLCPHCEGLRPRTLSSSGPLTSRVGNHREPGWPPWGLGLHRLTSRECQLVPRHTAWEDQDSGMAEARGRREIPETRPDEGPRAWGTDDASSQGCGVCPSIIKGAPVVPDSGVCVWGREGRT